MYIKSVNHCIYVVWCRLGKLKEEHHFQLCCFNFRLIYALRSRRYLTYSFIKLLLHCVLSMYHKINQCVCFYPWGFLLLEDQESIDNLFTAIGNIFWNELSSGGIILQQWQWNGLFAIRAQGSSPHGYCPGQCLLLALRHISFQEGPVSVLGMVISPIVQASPLGVSLGYLLPFPPFILPSFNLKKLSSYSLCSFCPYCHGLYSSPYHFGAHFCNNFAVLFLHLLTFPFWIYHPFYCQGGFL